MTVLIIINTTIFSLIAALHFYWAFGGQRFKFTVLPKHTAGETVFRPGFISTIIVAIGLVVFAVITVGNLGWFDDFISRKFIHYSTYVISVIFILRAIGEFKYVGFFKKVKGTDFAANDTKMFSPLSLAIGLISLGIVVWN